MSEIDIFGGIYPERDRDTKTRKLEKTLKRVREAKKFGWEYFDKKGVCYDGYVYDGRWIPIAKRFIELYNLKKGDKVLDVGCFTGDTIITTSNFIPYNISELKENDAVYTHNNNIMKISNLRKRCVDKILKIDAGYGNILKTTNEHPFLIEGKEWVIASNLKVGDLLSIPRLKNKEKIVVTEELSFLLGIYLAEGNPIYSHKPKFGGLNFTLSIKEREIADKIKDCAIKCGASSVTIKERKTKNTIDIYAYGMKLANLIVNMGGRYSHSKQLSREVINWDDKSKLNLLKAWLLGDGHKVKRDGYQYVGTTVSKNLAHQLRQISIQLGILPCLYNRLPATRSKYRRYDIHFTNIEDIIKLGVVLNRKRAPNKKRGYYVTDDFILTPIKSIVNENKSEYVYNFEVDGDNSYIANFICVHNCAKGYLVYDFVGLGIDAYGVDISQYAIDCAPPEVKYRLKVMNAKNLEVYKDKAFDLVISINTIHNLPEKDCRKAIREIQRIGKKAFIIVDSWRTKEEKQRMMDWCLTGVTVKSTKDWEKMFKEEGYTGYFYWFIP